MIAVSHTQRRYILTIASATPFKKNFTVQRWPGVGAQLERGRIAMARGRPMLSPTNSPKPAPLQHYDVPSRFQARAAVERGH